MRRNSSQKPKGFALVITLLMLLVTTLIVLGLTNFSFFEISITRNDRLKVDAFYASEAGIQVALDKLPSITPIQPTQLENGSSYWSGSFSDRSSPKSLQTMGNYTMPGFDSNWTSKRFQINTTGESLGATREIEVQAAEGPLTVTTSYNN